MTIKPTVEYSTKGAVATITLNRPDMLNAMDNDLMLGISECMDRIEQEKHIRVLVLTGAGRAFCAGADLSGSGDEEPEDPGKVLEKYFNPVAKAIYNSPVPTIARVNGATSGGGLGLALTCDIVVAANSAVFVAPFGPLLGIVPDLGSTWNLPRRVGRARALGSALLGDRISAQQAEDWGLIWKAVADEDLDTEIDKITAKLADASPDTMVRIRQTLDAAYVNSFSDQLDLELSHQSVLIPRNIKEAATAFMEKRKPVFKGREPE